jgi:hypothetical protein
MQNFFCYISNMKIKKSQIILIIGTFLGVYILLAGYLSILKPVDVKIEEENIEMPETPSEIVVKPLSGESNKIESDTTSEIMPEIGPKALFEEANNVAVSLQVLDKKYELEINEGANVFDAMKKLQETKKNEFSFKYKEYPGMGVFVYEINGMKGKRGAYWIYYVNEKEASVGVSSYTLSEGDSILWKQE